MSMFALKIIACISMLLDHIGYSYDISALRIIGRISFPIYAYLLTSGYIHTKNLRNYFLRLLIFSFLVEIPYRYFIYGNIIGNGLNNIFFTLTLGLLAIHIYQLMHDSKYKKITLIPVIFICLLGGFINVSYGFLGVLTIVTFYIFKDNKTKTTIAFFILTLIPFLGSLPLLPSSYMLNIIIPTNVSIEWLFVQLFKIFALIPIFMYNGKKGFTTKSRLGNKCIQYGFYLFYPIHIIVLILLT